MTPRVGPPWRLALLAALVALAAFAMLQGASWIIAGGVFEYPQDDPYIHLAIAEEITRGGYGVNPGEHAAAASSPLYPLLLTPFAGTDFHRFMPLVWNLVGLTLAAALWGRILWRAGYGEGGMGLALAVLGPLAMNLVGVAYTGMEHSLHAAASLAIVAGLLLWLDERRIGAALVLGILLAPLLRFEGLALAGLAALAVMATGRVRAGLGLGLLAVLPVTGFMAFLVSLGLEPLPSSVAAKLAGAQEEATGFLGQFLPKLSDIVQGPRQQVLAAMLAVALILALTPRVRASGRLPLVLVILGAGLAHMAAGRFGWMDRYEVYALYATAAGLLAVAAVPVGRALPWLAAAPVLFAASFYAPRLVTSYPDAARGIHLQHAQTARLVKEYLREPVAVNDLGQVSWQNPEYVLDVWGLANRAALQTRLNDPRPGWIDALTDAQGVRFAALYDEWFTDELADDWQLLGQMKTDRDYRYLGGSTVNFWLTGPGDPAPYLAKLADWSRDLPEGATWSEAPR